MNINTKKTMCYNIIRLKANKILIFRLRLIGKPSHHISQTYFIVNHSDDKIQSVFDKSRHRSRKIIMFTEEKKLNNQDNSNLSFPCKQILQPSNRNPEIGNKIYTAVQIGI